MVLTLQGFDVLPAFHQFDERVDDKTIGHDGAPLTWLKRQPRSPAAQGRLAASTDPRAIAPCVSAHVRSGQPCGRHRQPRFRGIVAKPWK
jgi:hypothetical protein